MPIIPLEKIDKRNPLYRLYEEVINQGKLEVLDELYADNYVNHITPFGLENTVEGDKKNIREQIKAFPDLRIKIEYWIQDGNKNIVKWTLKGTHTYQFCGIEPTGKKIERSGIDIDTVVDNKITEHDGAEDMLSLLQQIGVVKKLFFLD